MSAPKDIFHFPRPKEAKHCLDLLDSGAAQALVMFGARRTGKTRFLLRDLAPLAESKKIKTIYVSFWQGLDPPQDMLAAEIERRLSARTPEALSQLWRRLEASATLKSPDIPGTPSAALTVSAKAGAAAARRALLQLDTLFDRVCGARAKALFLFDEVQQLALSEAHGPFIAQLRTSLDKRSGRALAVFTGSSESGLHAMFAKRDAPLFKLGNRISLKPLGAEFIAHQHAALTQRGVHVPLAKLDAALSALNRRAAEFELFRNKLIGQDPPNAGAALKETLAEIADFHGFPRDWNALGLIHRATLRVLAEGEEQPYSDIALRRIGALLRKAPPEASTVQGALRTLQRRNVVQQFERRGPFQFVNDAYPGWIKLRTPSDFAD
eukprot:Opistho-1_new@53648